MAAELDPTLANLLQQANAPVNTSGDIDNTDLGFATGEPSDFTIIPKDTWVPVEITRANVKSSSKGDRMLDMEVVVLDGPYKNRKIWDKPMLEGNGAPNSITLAAAIGMYDSVNKKIVGKASDMLGRKLWIQLTVDEESTGADANGNPKTYPAKNRFGYCKYESLDKRALEAPTIPPPPPAPVGVQAPPKAAAVVDSSKPSWDSVPVDED